MRIKEKPDNGLILTNILFSTFQLSEIVEFRKGTIKSFQQGFVIIRAIFHCGDASRIFYLSSVMPKKAVKFHNSSNFVTLIMRKLGSL